MSNPIASDLKKYKIVFLGDASVGKTSIIYQFLHETFDQSNRATIGLDFYSKTIYLHNQAIKLQVWDILRQERFFSVSPCYVRGCSAAIVVYDITQEQSFLNTEKWIELVRDIRGQEAPIVLVGTKTDLANKRTVSFRDGFERANSKGVLFREVSSKTGENVQSLFTSLIQELPVLEESMLKNNHGVKFILRDKSRQEVQERGCKC